MSEGATFTAAPRTKHHLYFLFVNREHFKKDLWSLQVASSTPQSSTEWCFRYFLSIKWLYCEKVWSSLQLSRRCTRSMKPASKESLGWCVKPKCQTRTYWTPTYWYSPGSEKDDLSALFLFRCPQLKFVGRVKNVDVIFLHSKRAPWLHPWKIATEENPKNTKRS